MSEKAPEARRIRYPAGGPSLRRPGVQQRVTNILMADSYSVCVMMLDIISMQRKEADIANSVIMLPLRHSQRVNRATTSTCEDHLNWSTAVMRLSV